MPDVTIKIPEADVADAKLAVGAYTSLPSTEPAKTLAAAMLNTLINNYRQNHSVVPKAGVE